MTRPSKPELESEGKRDSLADTDARPAGSWLTILGAGEAVISEKGFARATVDDVCRRANVSADVFYAHFQGKGALLRALNERFVDQVNAVIDQATRSGIWSNAEATELLEVAVRSILDVVMDHAGLVSAFLVHGATDRKVAEGLRRIGTHLTERVTVALGECRNPPPNDGRSIPFALLLTAALAHHSILVGDAWSGVAFTRAELAHEMARAFGAYLALSHVDQAG